jgi:hypothetical protein
MITADESFLDRLCDRAAQPVNRSSFAAVGLTRGALLYGQH